MSPDTTSDTDDHSDKHDAGLSRRSMLKATGAAGAVSMLPLNAAATTERTQLRTIDDALDTSDGLQEVLVVFASNAAVDQLGMLDFQHDSEKDYHQFAVLPIGYTVLTGTQIETVAGWTDVRYVQKNSKLTLHNDDAREVTGAKEVQEDLFYTGESVHAVVIDSGIDGDHPDHRDGLRHNYKYTNPLSRETMWVDVGSVDTDDNGHGTHTSGSVTGNGAASGGKYRGMAPDADLTVYSTGVTLFLINVVGAFDHLIERQRAGETNVQLTSNSYGPSSGAQQNFHPNDALNVATFHAFEEGILSLFSAGNSGPNSNTLSEYAKAPHNIGVAATTDQTAVTDFSSRGREPDYDGIANYDRQLALSNLREFYETGTGSRPYGIYRLGVGATGNLVVSTMAPNDPLQAGSADDGLIYYAAISGTSMSCPTTAGVVALVIDAYRQNHGEYPAPLDVLNTIEATAHDARPDHNAYNIGTGFVDANAAVKRAEAGNLATFADVTTEDYARNGEAPEPVFAPTGSRADDGSVFTAGQTNQVDLTVDSLVTAGTATATVRDRIPFDWDVVSGDAHTVYTEDGTRYVEFDAAVSAGETRTYFIEAPHETGTYAFGPAEANWVEGSSLFDRFTGTDTNTVGGEDTNTEQK